MSALRCATWPRDGRSAENVDIGGVRVLTIGVQNASVSGSILYVEFMSVSTAARRLGVTERAVRQQVTAGGLAGRRRGRDWEVAAADVERRARLKPGRGRMLKPAMAWAVILDASGDHERARALLGSPALVRRMRRWRQENSLVDSSPRLASRAAVETFDVHDAEQARLLHRDDIARTGMSAAEEVGLTGTSRGGEVYAPADHRDTLISEHALIPGPGPLTVRWVDPFLWDALKAHGDRRAPRAAIFVDLLDSDDPRARREATRALNA